MTSIKISLNNDVRRVKVDLALPDAFEKTVAQLKAAFNLAADTGISLKYHDDEDELITVSSSVELVEAARIAADLGRKNLKLFAFLQGSSSVPAEVDDSASEVSTGSFVDLTKTVAPAEAEKSAPAPVKVSEVVIEDCPNDEDDPFASENKAPPAQEAPSAPAPEASASPAAKIQSDALPDFHQLHGLFMDFILNPKVQAAARSLVPTVLPSILNGSLDVDATVEVALAALAEAGPEVRNHPLIQAVEPHRPALVAKAKELLLLKDQLLSGCGLGSLLNLFDIDVFFGEEAPAPEPAVAPQDSGKPIHAGIECDGCHAHPLVGVRYKCTRCPDFDLCGDCEAKGVHPTDHVLLKINHPPKEPPRFDEQGRAIHRNVTCDGCGQNPLVGPRFKCTVCDNFDLCEACEQKGIHSSEHPLLKIREPVQHRPAHHGHHGFHGRHHGHPLRSMFGRHCHRRVPQFLSALLGPGGVFGLAGQTQPQPQARCPASAGAGFTGGCRRPVSRCARGAASQDPLAAYVSDFTIPDKSRCLPGVTLKKTWLVKNTGVAPWPADTTLVYESGTVVAAPDADVSVPLAGPGEIVPVSINVLTPATLGHHFGYFRLARPGVQVFGDRIFVEIVVDAATPPPPTTPTLPLTDDELKTKGQSAAGAMPLPRPSTPPSPAPAVQPAVAAVPAVVVAPPAPAVVPVPAPVEAAAPVVAAPSPVAPVAAPVAPVAAVPPAPARAANYRFPDQLAALVNMGFESPVAQAALNATRGDIDAAIERLLA